MTTFKKILLYAGMVVSFIVLVVCTAGVVGTWYLNTPLTEAVLGVVLPVTDAMQLAEDVTGETGIVLETVSTGLDEAQQQIEAISEEVVDTKVAVEAISALVGEDIQPQVDEVKANIKAIYNTLGHHARGHLGVQRHSVHRP